MQTSTMQGIVAAAGQGKKLNVMGHSVTVVLSKKETAGNHYVFEVVTPPGHGIPPHVHDREDELIYVVEGEYAVMIGDKQYIAKQGDELFFPRHIPHAFQNIGPHAGKTLWTVVPGGSFEDFFEELAALPPGEPDLVKVATVFAKYGMEVFVNKVA